jgi:septal ring factor EnvC (AmiA/AmiB activator)
MRSLEKDLERVTADLAAVEADLARLDARAEGLRAERDSLTRALAKVQPGRSPATDNIANMVKGDAIVAVLRNAKPRPLRAQGIVNALHRAGRTNEVAQNVSVYLDNLLKQGRVVRVARGEYTVPD